MLMRDVAHETRNGGEAFAVCIYCTSSDRHGTERKREQVVAVSGQTQREQPRATERRRCVHAQRGQCSRSELSERAPKPAREPALAGPHDTWVHPSEQTETARLGLQRPVRVSQTAVGCQGAIRHESHHAQVWVRA